MEQYLSFKAVLAPSDTAVVLGKDSGEILREEFYGNLDNNAKYIAVIPLCCAAADKGLVLKIISDMESLKIRHAQCGGIHVYQTGAENESAEFLPIEGGESALTAKGLVLAAEIVRKRHIEKLLESGVVIFQPHTVSIDLTAEIEAGAKIYQNNLITGKSVIKGGAVLMPNNNISCSYIGENVTVTSSTLCEATVGKGSSVGPNAYLRPHAEIGENCRIGDFVEIKNAKIGNGTKVSHLAYVGDAEVGECCNIGCGVIFVNYNGKSKSKTKVGSHAFIGSNCNVIAPVEIGGGVFIAAGTTVSKNLPPDAFVIGRCREEIKEGRAKEYLE